MATGITLDDLLNTMQKAGVPMNTMSGQPTYKNRSDLMTASKSMVPEAMKAYQPNADKYRQDYMSKIAKIAEMDQRLAGVYGDPSSNLYIEHAGQREGAIYGARPVTEAQTQEPVSAYNQEVEQFNQLVDKAQSAYNELIAQQKEGEKKKGESILLKDEIDRLLGNDTKKQGKQDLSSFIEDDLSRFIEPENLPFTL